MSGNVPLGPEDAGRYDMEAWDAEWAADRARAEVQAAVKAVLDEYRRDEDALPSVMFDGTPFPDLVPLDRIRAALSDTAALDRMLAEARAEAWDEGYATCLGDFDIAARAEARSENPYRAEGEGA